MTIKSLTSKTFVAQFDQPQTVIDPDNLGADLAKKLGDLGISAADLKKIAGADGRLRSSADFKKLFALVDGFDGAADKRLALTDGSKAPTVAGQLNQALLDEVKTNLGFAQYATGSRRVAKQPELKVIANALVVDPKDQMSAVSLPMKGLDQTVYGPPLGLDGQEACMRTAVAQAEQYLAKALGRNAPTLNPHNDSIQVAYAEDDDGRIQPDAAQLKLGRDYIDKSLDVGYPVVIGVSYGTHVENHDKLTEHFVTIHKRGYDKDGRQFYEFKDPGNSGATGRLYVDKDTGKLFKEGDHKSGYVVSLDYELTQVRTWKGLE